MNIAESVRTYLSGCPLLKDGKLNVDFLGDKAGEYTIEPMPVRQIVKRYTDGASVRQYLFIFGSREYWGDDTRQNMANSGFYEDFSSWLEQQSDAGNLPNMGAGKEARRIEALSTGYLFDETANTARYQIQCRLTYYQDTI